MLLQEKENLVIERFFKKTKREVRGQGTCWLLRTLEPGGVWVWFQKKISFCGERSCRILWSGRTLVVNGGVYKHWGLLWTRGLVDPGMFYRRSGSAAETLVIRIDGVCQEIQFTVNFSKLLGFNSWQRKLSDWKLCWFRGYILSRLSFIIRWTIKILRNRDQFFSELLLWWYSLTTVSVFCVDLMRTNQYIII